MMSSGLLFSAPASAADITAPATPNAVVNAMGEDLQEAMLSGSIHVALLKAVKGADALRISVSCYGSSATLSGAVQDRGSEKLAMAAARQVQGVTAVHSVITVNPRAALQDNLDAHLRDAMVVANVKVLLLQELGATAIRLHVTGANGVVSLSGEIPATASRPTVLKHVQETPGVLRVEDLMTAAP
jgi:osmotically-inducible protein OsmY